MTITIQIKTKEEVKYPTIGLSKTGDATVSVDFLYQSSVLNTDGSPSSAIFKTNISGDTEYGTMQVVFDYDSTLDIQEQAESKLKTIFS